MPAWPVVVRWPSPIDVCVCVAQKAQVVWYTPIDAQASSSLRMQASYASLGKDWVCGAQSNMHISIQHFGFKVHTMYHCVAYPDQE